MISDVVDEIGTRTKRRCRELVTKTAIPHIDEADESGGGLAGVAGRHMLLFRT